MSECSVEDLIFVPANGDGEKTATDISIIGDVDRVDGFSIMHGGEDGFGSLHQLRATSSSPRGSNAPSEILATKTSHTSNRTTSRSSPVSYAAAQRVRSSPPPPLSCSRARSPAWPPVLGVTLLAP
jgi:hypothetical protein